MSSLFPTTKSTLILTTSCHKSFRLPSSKPTILRITILWLIKRYTTPTCWRNTMNQNKIYSLIRRASSKINILSLPKPQINTPTLLVLKVSSKKDKTEALKTVPIKCQAHNKIEAITIEKCLHYRVMLTDGCLSRFLQIFKSREWAILMATLRNKSAGQWFCLNRKKTIKWTRPQVNKARKVTHMKGLTRSIKMTFRKKILLRAR